MIVVMITTFALSVAAKNIQPTETQMKEQLVPDEETYEAVRLELEDRSDPDIFYFTAGKYNPSGRQAYKHKDHYFSYLK